MRRRLANFLRALAWRVDPHVYYPPVELPPLSREDVDDLYDGVVPPGRVVW